MLLEKKKKLNILEEEIKKKRNELKKLKIDIGTKNQPNSHSGKLLIATQNLYYLSRMFKFSISIGLRYQKTKIKKNPKFYLRVKSYDNNFKNIYIGRPSDIKKTLFKIRDFSFEKYDNEELKSELKSLYTVYIRYFVWKNNWKTFFSQKHTLDHIEKWCSTMSNEFLRW